MEKGENQKVRTSHFMLHYKNLSSDVHTELISSISLAS